MEWYVARDGKTFGPFSFEDMKRGAREGELRDGDLVWSSGMADWTPVSQVYQLWPPEVRQEPEPQEPEPQEPEPHRPEAASSEPARNNDRGSHHGASRANLIVRHWRGQLSLGQAYWGIGFLLGIGIVLLGYAVGAITTPLDVRSGSAILAIFLIFVCATVIWQVVGVWRAAGNHIARTGRYFWAVVARFMMILATINSCKDFVNVISPMLSEFSKVAMGIDNTPAHQLRLLRGGTELELSGGMPFGTASALKALLDAAPTVKIIHLNSFGGRIAEGYEVYKLVQNHKLITYTSTNCVSACTIAFLAGVERFLASRARLGFHSANLGGLDAKDLPEVNDAIRQTLKQHRVAPWFIEKALGTRADDVWYPSQSEMIQAGVVTKIVDAEQFGLSGVAGWRDRERLEDVLAAVPIFGVLKENDPEGFNALATRFADSVQAGKSMHEIVQEAQTVLMNEVLPKYLRSGPDVELVAYWKTQLAEMEYLNTTDASRCIEFLFPELRQKDFNAAKLIPDAMQKQDIAALSELVRATVLTPVLEKGTTVEQDINYVVNLLTARNQQASIVLQEPIKYISQPKLVCSTLIWFYKQIFTLPLQRSGAILRVIASK